MAFIEFGPPGKSDGFMEFSKPQEASSDTARGFKTAFQQLPQLGYGLAAITASAFESALGEGGLSTAAKNWSVDGYKSWGDKIRAQSRDTDEFDVVYERAKEGDFGALVDWLQYGVGYTVGQGIQMLTGAGAGAIAGRLALRPAVEKMAAGMVAKEAERLAAGGVAKELAQRQAVASLASQAGMLASTGALAFGMEGGEIGGDLAEKSVERGTPLTGTELARAAGATALAGMFEFAGDALGLGAMLGKIPVGKAVAGMPGVGGRAARGLIGGAMVAPAEGATEYLQTGAEEWGKGNEANILPWNQSPEAQRGALNAAALGALGGAVMGGAGGVLTGPKTEQDEERINAERSAQDVKNIVTAPSIDAAIAAADQAMGPQRPSFESLLNEDATRTLVGSLVRRNQEDPAYAQAAADLEARKNADFDAMMTGERDTRAEAATALSVRLENEQAAQEAGKAPPTGLIAGAMEGSLGTPRRIGESQGAYKRRVLLERMEAAGVQGQQQEPGAVPAATGATPPTAPAAPAAPLASPAPVQAAGPSRLPTPPAAPVATPPTVTPPVQTGQTPLAPIDQSAHKASTSPQNDIPQPTDGQKEAGNYKKGHDATTFPGLDLSIENPAGSKRRPEWPTLQQHYGYVKGSVGMDKDHLDVFVKPGTPQGWKGRVYVVNQNREDGKPDEHKAMLGFDSLDEARRAYLANYTAGWEKNIHSIVPMGLDAFKTWALDTTNGGPKGGRLMNANPGVRVMGKPVHQHTEKMLRTAAKSAKTAKQRAAAQEELDRREEERAARPMSEAEAKRREKLRQQAAERKKINVDTDSLIPAIIKLGGMSMSERLDTIGDDRGNVGLPGVGKLFSTRGTGADDLATRLGEYGYMTPAELDDVDGGVAALKEKIREEFNGQRTHWSIESDAHLHAEAERQADLAEQMADAMAEIEADTGVDLDLALTPEDLTDFNVVPEAEALVRGEMMARAEAIQEDIMERLAMQHDTDAAYWAAVAQFLKENEHAAVGDDPQADGAGQGEGQRPGVPGRDGASTQTEGEAPRAAEEDAAEVNRVPARANGDTRRIDPAENTEQTPPGPRQGRPAPFVFRMQNGSSAPVDSIEDAALKWEEFRTAQMNAGGGGVSEIGNGGTVYSGNQVVATITYNGNVTGPDGKKIRIGKVYDVDATITPEDTAGNDAQPGMLSNATAPEHVAGVDDRELSEIVDEFNDAQASMFEGEQQVTRVFEAPAKSEVVRLNDKVKVYHKEHGWMSVEQAKARISEWKEHARSQKKGSAGNGNANRVVLSLFDLTGSWSQPWEEAGYQVYRFDIQDDPVLGDVNKFSVEFFTDTFGDFDGNEVYAILAACPCTDFAVSGARHFAAKDRDGRTRASVDLVHNTLATIEFFKPAVWAIENPVGRIESLGGLPPWRLSFDPFHLGDTYTKKTLLWGRFNADLPIAPVDPVEGSKMHKKFGGKSQATKNARSETPEGFAYGFFMANNAIDNPVMAVANKYDRLDRDLIARALKAGVTEQQISEAVDDFYYMDLDDDAANAAIRALTAQAARPALDLSTQTRADLKAKEARAADETADNKAVADRERDLFQLTPQAAPEKTASTGDMFGAADMANQPKKRAAPPPPAGGLFAQPEKAPEKHRTFPKDAADRAREVLRRKLAAEQQDGKGAFERAWESLSEEERSTVENEVGREPFALAVARAAEGQNPAVQTWLASVSAQVRAIFRKVVAMLAAVVVALNVSTVQDAQAYPAPSGPATVRVQTLVEKPRADFGEVKPSAKSSLVANWIMATNAHRGESFIIADKAAGVMHAFASDGSLIETAPALYGASLKDELTPEQMRKPIERMTAEDKVTPAGIWNVQMIPDKDYGWRLDFKGGRGLAIHSVYLGTKSERRAERLASPTPADNFVSYGCINVPKDYFEGTLTEHFKGTQHGLFIIPVQTQNTERTFGIMAEDMMPEVVESEIQVESAGGVTRVSDTQGITGDTRRRLSRGMRSKTPDAETTQAGIALAGYYIEDGARTFDAYAEKMVADLGETVRPYLKSWYAAVYYYPNFDTTGMTEPGSIQESAAPEARTDMFPEEKAPAQRERKGTVGGKLEAGEVVLTNTGRRTSPFPKLNFGTNRGASATLKKVDRWLMQNALDEARSRGDTFNARQFEANLDKPQQADKDSAEEYLFGDYIPPVLPSTLKPLTQGTTAQPETPANPVAVAADALIKAAEAMKAAVTPQEKTKDQENEPNPLRGDRFTDAQGKLWEVWGNRNGRVEAFPVVDGKIRVNNQDGQMWSVTASARERFPDARTDFTPVKKKRAPVTPQIPSSSQMKSFIGIAADSIEQLRKSDVERVLTENPRIFRTSIALHIKQNRPDLSEEVDAILEEQDAEAQTPAVSSEVPAKKVVVVATHKATTGGTYEVRHDTAKDTWGAFYVNAEGISTGQWSAGQDAEQKARSQYDRWLKKDENDRLAMDENRRTETLDMSRPYTLAEQDKVQARIYEGDITAEELKAAYARAVSSRDAIVQELENMTKAQLLTIVGDTYRNDKKDRLVNAGYRELLKSFTLSRSISYMLGGQNAFENAINSIVQSITDQDIADFAKEIKERRAEREQRRSALLESIKDPQTMEDFETFLRVKKVSDMTTAQLERYDELMAERGRQRRASAQERSNQVRTASEAVGSSIVQTKHTKKGHDLFVVQLEKRVEREDYNRLNTAAKRLGGYYSAFRGGGAVPGFQFTTRENAEAFQKLVGGDATAATEAVQERRSSNREAKKNAAAERLADMADRMEEAAQEDLSRERLANTARRARMANAAEAQARATERMAKTLRAIADAIEEGRAKHLDGIRTRKQVEELDKILIAAKRTAIAKENTSRTYMDANEDRPPQLSDIVYAEYPQFTSVRSNFAAAARRLVEIPGAKMVGERLLKATDDAKDYAKEVGADPLKLGKVLLRLSGGDPAVFKTKAEADRSVRNSPHRHKVLVIPLTGKGMSGRFAAVLSPAEAKGRGLWQATDDPRITISPEVMEEILSKANAHNAKASWNEKVQLPYYFDGIQESRTRLRAMGLENSSELRAALREYLNLRAQESVANRVKELERALAGRQDVGFDFFPTPAPLAQRMAESLELQPGMTVLEPSAGKGNLADAVREAEPGAIIHTIEQSNTLAEILEAKGYEVIARNFDTFDPSQGPEPLYDRIIMNPPFSNGIDADHVRRAFGMLKPGGRLVAITGEGIFSRGDKKAMEFREWFDSVDGTAEEMEEAFTDRREVKTTTVRSRLLTIEKPGEPKFSLMDGPVQAAEDGGTLRYDQQAKADVDLLRAALGRKYAEGRSLAGLYRPVRLPDDGSLQAIAGAFGKRVVGLRVDSAKARGLPQVLSGFNGVTLPSASPAIYMIEGNTRPHLAILGHELVHQLRRDDSALYDEFAEAVRAYIKEDEYGARFGQKMGVMDPEILREEFMGEVVSDGFMSERFWTALGKANPTLLERVIKMVRALFERAMQAMGYTNKTERYLTDFDAVMDIAGNIMGRYKGNVEWGGTGSLKFSAKKSDPAADITKTPEFKAWFGDSKVVDAEGKPLRMYHGTTAAFSTYRVPAYFVDRAREAEEFASEREDGDVRVDTVYLSITNPKVIESFGDFAEWGASDVRKAVKQGYDGAVLKPTRPGEPRMYIAFHPEQIKSAIGNNGAFDPLNPDIRQSRKDAVSDDAPLSEAKFYSQYKLHIDLRGRQDGTAEENKASILRDGFRKGANVNALPPYRAGKPGNVVEARYRPQVGDVVYLAPKGAWNRKPNGVEIKDGWKPLPSEVVTITPENVDKSAYDLYLEGRGTKQAAWSAPQQKISSASTSISYPDPEKKSPVIFTAFKRGDIKLGPVNADIGGGRFDQITEWLAGRGVRNIVWDRFNRDAAHNDAAQAALAGGQADTATVSNVLNVIAERDARLGTIATAFDALKPGGVAYFSMYAAPKAGEVSGRDAYQVGRPAASYIPELEEVFGRGNVVKSGEILVATKPDIRASRSASAKGVTETPAFRRWFDGSKVVDAEGKPLVVYHGTNSDFSEFDTEKIKRAAAGRGFYFSSDRNQRGYAEGDGGNIMPVYLSIQRPTDDPYLFRTDSSYDGLIFPLKSTPGVTHYAVRDATQIKSAIGNSGDFNPEDPDITASRGRTATGMSTEEIEDALVVGMGPGVRKMIEDGVLVIARSRSALPDRVKRGMTDQDEAVYDMRTGTIYMVASSLRRDRVMPVFMHEVGEHYGLPRMLGRDGYARLREQVRQANGRIPGVSLAWQFVRENYPEVKEGGDRFISEVIAKVGESAAGRALPLYQRVIARVRQFLRELGLVKTVSDADLVVLVGAAARKAVSGDLVRYGADGEVQASTKAAPWYSELSRQIGMARQASAPAAQWKAFISGLKQKGVKADEIEWSGVMEWLDMQAGKVTKEALQSFLDNNGVRVEETMYGGDSSAQDYAAQRIIDDAKVRLDALGFDVGEFEEFEMDGTYRMTYISRRSDGEEWDVEEVMDGKADVPEEVLVHVGRIIQALEGVDDVPDDNSARYAQYTLPGGENYRELLLTLPENDGGVAELEAAKQEAMLALIKEFENDSGLQRHQTIEIAQGARQGLKRMEDMIRQAMGTKKADEYIERARAAQNAYNDAFTARLNSRFKSSHWNEPNIIAHVRFNERRDADGKRVLFIEEIQSDWAQKGKKGGFREEFNKPKPVVTAEATTVADYAAKAEIDPTEWIAGRNAIRDVLGDPLLTPESKIVIVYLDGSPMKAVDRVTTPEEQITRMQRAIDREWEAQASTHRMQNAGRPPAAPFVQKTDAWVALAVKRMIRYAAENNFDRVAFVTGEQSADRYDLSKQIDAIKVTRDGDGFTIAMKPRGGRYSFQNNWKGSAAQLPEVVGKDLAEKIVAIPDGSIREFSGIDLRVGGEGMIAFYNKIVPSVVNDVLKKMGGGKIMRVMVTGMVPDDMRVSTFSDGSAAVEEGGESIEFDSVEKAEAYQNRKRAPQEQPGFDITPDMREKALGGLPLFSRKADLTSTAAFRRWFDGSKVVDAEGRPLVVYHGTAADEDFSEFAPFADVLGTHFGTVEQANNRTGRMMDGRLMPVYLALKNPLRLTDPGTQYWAGDVVAKQLERLGILEAGEWDRLSDYDLQDQGEALVDAIERAGYDGVVYANRSEALRRLEKGERAPLTFERNDALGKGAGVDKTFIARLASGETAGYGRTEEEARTNAEAALRKKALLPSGDSYIAFRPEQIKSAIGNSGNFDPNDGDIRASRMPAAGSVSLPGTEESLTVKASAFLRNMMHSDARFNWWHRSIGTQQHKAMVNPAFGKVYDLGQAFLADVSKFANESADLASDLLPRIEKFSDFTKKSPSKEDVERVTEALYAGTLWGGGSPLEGRRWTAEELSTGRAKDGTLSMPAFKPLNDAQAKLYGEALDAVGSSLESMAKSLIYRTVKTVGIQFDRDMTLEDVAQVVRDQIQTAIEDLSVELEYLTDQDRIDQQAADIADMEDDGRPGAGGAADKFRKEQEREAEKVQDQIDALEGMRAAVDDIESKTRTLVRRGYFPAMRFGQYAVHVVEEVEGQPVQRYFGLFETQTAANLAARELAKEFPQADIQRGMISKEQHRLFQGLSLDALEAFAEHITGEDGQPIARDPLVQGFLKAAVSERSTLKRNIHRKGTAGYSEDLTRVLASFVVSTSRATASNYRAADMLMAANEIKAGDVKDEAIKLARYLMDPQEEAQAIRGFLFAQFLGGSIAHGLVNMTQPFMVTAPYLSQFTTAADAAAKVVKAATTKPESLTGALADAFARAKREGVVAPQEIHQLRAETGGMPLAKNIALRKLSFLWGSIYAVTEQFNRSSAFIAAYRIAQEKRMPNPYDFAVRAVNETQFVYNKGARPNWARGSVGSVVFTFKQFSIAYLELAKRLYAKDKKAFALMAMMLVVGAGLEGLPFAEDLEDLIDTLGQWMGYATNSKKSLRKWATTLLGPDLAEVALNGISGLPWMPVDVSQRLGLQNLVPGTGMLKLSEKNKAGDVLEIVGPIGQFVPTENTMLGKAIERLANGDILGAIKGGAPVAVQNVAKGAEMLDKGYATDGRGRKVMEVTPSGAVLKMAGLQPANLAREGRRVSEVKQDIDLQRRTEAEIAEKWARGQIDGEPEKVREAMAMLREWNANNPELRIRISAEQIRQRMLEARKTRAQRFVKSTPPEIRATVREDLK